MAKYRLLRVGHCLAWMSEVVTEGTGQSLQERQMEAGREVRNRTNSKWEPRESESMVYWLWPRGAPQYAVSVVIKNTDPTESNKAIPLFKGIMDILASQGLSNSK